MVYSKQLANIIKADIIQQGNESVLEQLCTDSRTISYPESSLFFALVTPTRNGHEYIKDAYNKGVRHFVISEKISTIAFKKATFYLVPSALLAMQHLAAYHRAQHKLEVIGITGSNGKTVVKEWLFQALQHDYNVVRSPKSYNSQIGVPLSVWATTTQHTLGIFEAGISTTNEMKQLEKIIQPSIGIFTNVGSAHNEGFTSTKQKIEEKIKLFINCKVVFYANKYTELQEHLHTLAAKKGCTLISWGTAKDSTIKIRKQTTLKDKTQIQLQYQKNNLLISLPFTDSASVENCMHVVAVLLYKRYTQKQINLQLQQLQPITHRLQQKKAIHHSILLNDSYSNDLVSLEIALHHLAQQNSKLHKVLVLSDLEQTGADAAVLYKNVASLVAAANIQQLIAVGPTLSSYQKYFDAVNSKIFVDNTKQALDYCTNNQISNAAILVKGARSFRLEQVVQLLEEKVHQTILEINTEHLVYNIKQHQQLVKPQTKIMAVVKAFGYGSGSVEIAQVLQKQGIQYLAVAYADEAVALRQAGIHLPIMVMNVEEYAFDAITNHQLEPEIYSLAVLNKFMHHIQQLGLVQYPIHIKIDTGMHRLGFLANEIDSLAEKLQQQRLLKVVSIFSHLVASEDKKQDAYTKQQNTQFEQLAHQISKAIGYTPLLHIANTSAIQRHPHMQHTMVRLGIGMYGAVSSRQNLLPVCSLKTTIAQIKHLKKGDTIGYNRHGVLSKDSTIAIIRIGYADGYSRQLGNGVGKVLINGKLAPILGNICMDMTMVDITNIPNVTEETIVTLYGEQPTVAQLAAWCQTIPYEILTRVSERVKRVYIGS